MTPLLCTMSGLLGAHHAAQAPQVADRSGRGRQASDQQQAERAPGEPRRPPIHPPAPAAAGNGTTVTVTPSARTPLDEGPLGRRHDAQRPVGLRVAQSGQQFEERRFGARRTVRSD